jgi:hypothetical protein
MSIHKDESEKAQQNLMVCLVEADEANLAALLAAGYAANASAATRKAWADAVRRCLWGDYGIEAMQAAEEALAEAREKE